MSNTPTYMLCQLQNVGSMTTLDNTKGSSGQIAMRDSDGSIYIKHGGAWQQIWNGSAEVGLAITVKNSSGSISRSLTESNGVVNLAATDTIVANGDSPVLKKSDGATTSTGNAGLNSPASAVVSAGVLQNVKASA